MARPQLMSVVEAAELLKLHPTRVRLLCRQGRIRGTRVGNAWVITDKEVKRFAAIERKTGRPPA